MRELAGAGVRVGGWAGGRRVARNRAPELPLSGPRACLVRQLGSAQVVPSRARCQRGASGASGVRAGCEWDGLEIAGDCGPPRLPRV